MSGVLGGAILWLMPERRITPRLQVALGAAYAAAGFVLQYRLSGLLHGFPLLLFVPAVFFSALSLGKIGGLSTTLIGATLAAYFIVEPKNSFALTTSSAIAVAIFVILGIAMSLVIEAFCDTIDRLNASEAAQALLLEELAHRTKNDLAIISSAITLQRNSSSDPAVRDALSSANARVLVVARAQERLRGGKASGRVDLSTYVSDLCRDLGDLLRDVRPVAVEVTSPQLLVPADLAVNVGLIVNELVTNSLKYAFPDEREGLIEVSLQPHEDRLIVEVQDNGVGCESSDQPGLGSKLVKLLAKQLGGAVDRQAADPGHRVRVTLAGTAGEMDGALSFDCGR